MARLTARGLTVAYGGVEVLSDVDLDLRPGVIHAIVGENGAGKSTLAKACSGIVAPLGGDLAIDGAVCRFANPRQALDSGVCLVHQEPLGFPDLSVAENIFAGNWAGGRWGINWKTILTESERQLERLGFEIDVRRPAKTLSGAERQAVELAHGLSRGARVWFFDETTAALTPTESGRLFRVMRQLADEGCSVAFVSHHLQEVVAHADEVTVLRDGHKVGRLDHGTFTTGDLVKLMVGRSVELDAPCPHQPGDTVLRIKGLNVPRAVADVSIEVHAGEVVALAGLVGAGRTEVALAVCGLAAYTGDIEIAGRPVGHQGPHKRWREGLAFVPEDRQHQGLLLPLSIAKNATIASLARFSRLGWLDDRAVDAATVAAGAEMGLVYRSPGQEVRFLSGGNQQKVALSKALVSKPKLLILDEPTKGVDIGAKYDVHALIRRLAVAGVGVLLISSDLPEVMALGHRVVVMRKGRVAFEFGPGAASPEAIIAHASGSEDALAS